MAIGAAVLPLLFGIGAGVISNMITNRGTSQQASAPIPLPQAPSPDDSAAKASDIIRRRRASMTQSIYTSPLGVSGQAQVAQKTLLGQ